jgi:hypothetical protein
MILFLDDNPYRTKKFKSEVPQAFTAETAQEMIALLTKEEEVEMLFLDHDLGGKEYVNSDEANCGMEVVRWIIAHQPKIGQVVIHSCNPPAAQRMEDALAAAGYDVVRVPFPSLKLQAIKPQ